MNQRLCNGPVDYYGRMDSGDSLNYMNYQNGRVDHLNAESNSMMRSNMGYNSWMGNIGAGDGKFSQNLSKIDLVGSGGYQRSNMDLPRPIQHNAGFSSENRNMGLNFGNLYSQNRQHKTLSPSMIDMMEVLHGKIILRILRDVQELMFGMKLKRLIFLLLA